MKKAKVLGVVLLAAGFAGFTYKNDIHAMGLRFVAPTVKGLLNIDNPEKGEIVFESNDGFFYGFTGSAWTKLSAGETAVPLGSIMPFGGKNESIPSGYLPADGRAVLISEYPDLFTAIGTSYGSGLKNNDGSDTGYAQNTAFNLPDLRGRFMRGVDGGTGRDPDASTRVTSQVGDGGKTGAEIGSVQSGAIQSHYHVGAFVATVGARFGYTNTGINSNYWEPGSGASGTQGANSSSTGGSETRPVNIYVNFIIKAK